MPAWRGVCGPRCWAWGQRGLYMDTPEVPGGASSIWGLGGYFRAENLLFHPQTPKTCRSAGGGEQGAGLHGSLPAASGSSALKGRAGG